MKLLIVTQYYWPESFIINDLVRTLKAQGNEIHVLTGKPNYPDGQIFSGYSQSGCLTEMFDGSVPVYRVPLRPRKHGGAVNLVLNYLSFVVSGLFYFPRFVKNQRYDVIFVFAPSPITQAIPAIFLNWRLKSHLAIWVQDLWPDSLEATGFVRNKWALKLVGYLVRYIYSRTDTLLIQSRSFFSPIAKLSDPEKIEYYPNSMLQNKDMVAFDLPSDLLQILESNFCIVFAGNLGSAQSLETIVTAAEILKAKVNIKFVLVGSGSMQTWLKTQKQILGLSNVEIVGRFPMQAMPTIYQHASALLVTLKDEAIFSKTIPSKIQAYLASGRPIIAALNGEGARVVEEAKAGLSCKAEDAHGLAECVNNIYQMSSEERAAMGNSGYDYFLQHFEMSSQALNLIKLLQQRILLTQGVKK